MSEIYLRECFIENIGPIKNLDISLKLNSKGNPKPVVFVGKNGTGKTIFLAHVLDALVEFAKKRFRDIVAGQRVGYDPYLKLTSEGNNYGLTSTAISLLEFKGHNSRFSYMDKTGDVKFKDYEEKTRGRFSGVSLLQNGSPTQKAVSGDGEKIETWFEESSICFFPSSRHEKPHWLNDDAKVDEPVFGTKRWTSGLLGKPIIVERAWDQNNSWLFDVIVDSLSDLDLSNLKFGDPNNYDSSKWVMKSDIEDKLAFNLGRHNIEVLLKAVLEDSQARYIIQHRNTSHGRIAIQLSDGKIIPSLKHLSAGQSILLNMFNTILRYSDYHDLNKSIHPADVQGIVVVDEIEMHLHSDLQYRILPHLIKLFPNIQFIMTSHSPLFLLGLEKLFGSDGIQIFDMPDGISISTERFEEFQKSMEFYFETKSFEEKVEKKLTSTNKPLILTEGYTDALFIKAGLELLGYQELLNNIEIDEVGRSDKGGSKGSGHSNLDVAKKFLENNSTRFPRKVLLLYDCDTKKSNEESGPLWVRMIPENIANNTVTKGFENLFPPDLFEERFYQEKSKPTGYGKDNTIIEFKKSDFCKFLCDERKNKDDFLYFSDLLLPIILEFINK